VTKTLKELKEHLHSECEEDEVGLWYIVRGLRDDLGMNDDAEIRRSTRQLVRELLETGQIVAGWYAPPECGLPDWQIAPWPGSIDDILARISREWDCLGRDPNLGEIVILQAKPEDGQSQQEEAGPVAGTSD
jgi:hypothetical protein